MLHDWASWRDEGRGRAGRTCAHARIAARRAAIWWRRPRAVATRVRRVPWRAPASHAATALLRIAAVRRSSANAPALARGARRAAQAPGARGACGVRGRVGWADSHAIRSLMSLTASPHVFTMRRSSMWSRRRRKTATRWRRHTRWDAACAHAPKTARLNRAPRKRSTRLQDLEMTRASAQCSDHSTSVSLCVSLFWRCSTRVAAERKWW